MTIQIEEGKYYERADGSVHGPARRANDHRYPWQVGSETYTDGGRFRKHVSVDDWNLVAEASAPVTDDHAVETVEGPQIAEPPEWHGYTITGLDPAKNEADDPFPNYVPGYPVSDEIREAAKQYDYATDVKAQIADEAKRIVSGARRSAYGKPEQNFERIARLWQAHFENTGRPEAKVTANDISVFMVLMKIGRIAESPAHYDSWVDVVGYALTGAEVNGVTKPEKAA